MLRLSHTKESAMSRRILAFVVVGLSLAYAFRRLRLDPDTSEVNGRPMDLMGLEFE